MSTRLVREQRQREERAFHLVALREREEDALDQDGRVEQRRHGIGAHGEHEDEERARPERRRDLRHARGGRTSPAAPATSRAASSESAVERAEAREERERDQREERAREDPRGARVEDPEEGRAHVERASRDSASHCVTSPWRPRIRIQPIAWMCCGTSSGIDGERQQERRARGTRGTRAAPRAARRARTRRRVVSAASSRLFSRSSWMRGSSSVATRGARRRCPRRSGRRTGTRRRRAG